MSEKLAKLSVFQKALIALFQVHLHTEKRLNIWSGFMWITDGNAIQKVRDSPSGIINVALPAATHASMPAQHVASQAVESLLPRIQTLHLKSAAHLIVVNPTVVKMKITTKKLLRTNQMGRE